jgi:xanthine dehydrogenase YagR molybdenum-binding subunit
MEIENAEVTLRIEGDAVIASAPLPQQGPPKTKKVKTTVTVNGQEKEVEVEVPDVQVSWGTKAERREVGKRVSRLDGYDKVTGRAKYTYDINLPGMLWGKILRSPYANARIKSMDLEAAKAVPGVKAVLPLRSIGDTLRYHGDAIAALAASSPEVAEDAIRAIRVVYEPGPFVVHEEDARTPNAPYVLGNNRPNVEQSQANEKGNVGEAFGKADATVEGTFRAQARVHACLETHGHVVAPQKDGSLKIWSSTQAVHGTAEEFAGIAGLPKDRVELTCQHMGGGFGSKFGAGVEGKAAYDLARAANAPVKLMLDRHEEATASGHAPSAAIAVKMAGNKDGTILAVDSRGWASGGIGSGGNIPHPYIYDVPASRVVRESVRRNVQPANAMRAPGHPQASFLMESIVDELAYKLGIDPLEFRMKNDPFPIRQIEYKMGAERIGWAQNFNKTPGKGGPKLRGVGVACATWGGRGGQPSMKAEVAVANDGTLGFAPSLRALSLMSLGLSGVGSNPKSGRHACRFPAVRVAPPQPRWSPRR